MYLGMAPTAAQILLPSSKSFSGPIVHHMEPWIGIITAKASDVYRLYIYSIHIMQVQAQSSSYGSRTQEALYVSRPEYVKIHTHTHQDPLSPRATFQVFAPIASA